MKLGGMEKKPKVIERKTKVANGILRKQTLLNNNNIVKNLNEKVKKGSVGKATPKRKVSPVGAAEVTAPSLPQGCTPLMYACQQADERLVAEILKKEPGSVLKRDRTLKTALHYCFDNPTAATADRIVMAAPALLEARDQDGFTSLHLAVIQGNMPLVTFLLANNADVMAMDNEKHSVVHWATVCGELEALRAVLSAGADPSTADIHGGYPLHYAAQMCGGAGSSGAAGTGGTGGTGGVGGARLSLEVLGALLRAATRVDATDVQGRQPLLWASSAGSAPAILALVKAGAAVEAADKDGLTALHCAASRGHTECIETLLTLCGARPDVIDSNGCTALHYAVTLGHADATALLLDHGSDPNRQDRKGRSPAHCGCAKGQLETVRMLGARGANVWLRNAKGDLPLHEAVASGRRELVKWLLEIRPSQINATNNDGRTLLHIAANTDNTDLCKILLDFGAQVNAVLRTSKNILMTPLDCALHKGYRSTAKYLQMHGGLPASRLTSRHVLVNQETVPQIPVRHIKSTKINLKDNIAIEKREIFEMSPCSTPKHKYSSKAGSLVNSSECSSEDYEMENKRLREERRRQKKASQRHKKEHLKSSQNSISDDYESDELKKGRSSRQDKASSDSESSGYRHKKKNKRSKSEPSEKKTEKKLLKSQSKSRSKEKIAVAKSSDSDADKKYKKRRKTIAAKKSSGSGSPSSEGNKKSKSVDASSVAKVDKTEKTQKSLDKSEKDNETTIKVNDIIDKIESNLEKLDNVIESRISENEANTVSFIQTTLITEAQVHFESQASFEQDAKEETIIPIERAEMTHKESDAETQKIERSEIKVEYEAEAERDNEEAMQNERSDAIVLVEHHAEIKEENVETEIIENELEIPRHDSIIAIIPDIDTTDVDVAGEPEVDHSFQEVPKTPPDEELHKEDGIPSNDEKPSEDFIQAIIGILPDDESKVLTSAPSQETEESPDSLMGEAIKVEGGFQENIQRSITLIDGENLEELGALPKQESEETAISETSQKSNTSKHDDANANDAFLESDDVYDSNVQDSKLQRAKSSDRGIQKIYSDGIPGQKLSRRSSIQLSDDALQNRSFRSKGKELYETQSYRVLPEGLDHESNDEIDDANRQNNVLIQDSNVDMDEPDRFVKQASYTRRRMPSLSDNEMYSIVDSSGAVRRRRLKKRYRDKNRSSGIRSKSQNSDREYESSFFVDSGFEPSPRVYHQNRMMSPRLAAYYEDRNAGGVGDNAESKIPKRKPGDKNAVDMASVTQIVQTNMRRYFLERKIFQHLMDLKRIQIRSSKAHEAVLVKRAIDEYHRSSLAYVGAGRYTSNEFTYKSFEKFLYDSLRKLQKSGVHHLMNLPERAFPEFEGRNENTYRMDGLPDNPILCTSKTHRCYHAIHAYTGIPCSAYIPAKMNHHTMPKPGMKKGSFLPQINNKTGRKPNSQVTLELCHGNEKQMISLPAEKLDKNKRYYVTFTVKGSNNNSDNENKQLDDIQRNVKSV